MFVFSLPGVVMPDAGQTVPKPPRRGSSKSTAERKQPCLGRAAHSLCAGYQGMQAVRDGGQNPAGKSLHGLLSERQHH